MVWTWSWLYNCSYLAQSIQAWLCRSLSCFYCKHIQRHLMCFINSINPWRGTPLICQLWHFLLSFCSGRIPSQASLCIHITISYQVQEDQLTSSWIYSSKYPYQRSRLHYICCGTLGTLHVVLQTTKPKSIKILFSLGKSNSGCSCSDIWAMMAQGASSRVKWGSILITVCIRL